VSGLYYLREGTALKIAVGQIGKSVGAQMTQGGAGATFVIADDDAVFGVDWEGNTVLLVAGNMFPTFRFLPKWQSV